MFVLLFFLSVYTDLCQGQVMYSHVVPYDPRYALHRPPVRRSAMEALERLRLPVTRYFPQVDTQVASAPYQSPVAPLAGYQLSPDDLYALPPQWTEEFVQQLPERNEEEADYGNYEYENAFAPVYRPGVYADEVYAQEPIMEPETSDGNMYNDFMVNYLMGEGVPKEVIDQSEIFDMQRRSKDSGLESGVIPLTAVAEANKNATSVAANTNDATPAPPVPIPSQPAPQVQVTAVPAAPEKKEVKSLVIPEPSTANTAQTDGAFKDEGQKEVPLFRPLQNSQRTTWGDLTRVKNSQYKSPIPLLKQMIQNGQQKKVVDPLTEELNSLKKQRNA